MLNIVEHPWSRVFMKIFNTFDALTVRYCQHYTGFLPVEHIARLRKINFITGLKQSQCVMLQTLHNYVASNELRLIANVYNVNVADCYELNFKTIVTHHAALLLNLS